MVNMIGKQPSSHWWWLDCQSTSKRSQWLQSTLSELNEKTMAMLKLIEGDADSFAQRAEMYYKKRPEMLIMLQDFYRAHRLLAERYDQVKSDLGTRLLPILGSPFGSARHQTEKCDSFMDRNYESCSETCATEEVAESEVDDPEEEDVTKSQGGELEDEDEFEEVEVGQSVAQNEELLRLREEIEKLKEENRIQKDQLKEKDEDKLEVIRQLSVAINVLKEENVQMKTLIAKDLKKRPSAFGYSKLRGAFLGKLFNVFP